MKRTPSVVKDSKKGKDVKSSQDLFTVNGHYTPEGLTYRGKRVRSGVFVNVTGRSEKEKERLFALAKEELRQKAEGLDLYEIISV